MTNAPQQLPNPLKLYQALVLLIAQALLLLAWGIVVAIDMQNRRDRQRLEVEVYWGEEQLFPPEGGR